MFLSLYVLFKLPDILITDKVRYYSPNLTVMHKLTLVLLLTIIPVLGISQNTVTGKIVDELGLPIYMASVAIEQTDDITYTHSDGSFTLTSKKDFHWKVNITSKGYKPESFFVLSGGKTESLVLEYNAEMKSLLGDKIGLNQDFYWKPSNEAKLSSKSKPNRQLVVHTIR